jgi:hypothetical protein
MAHGHMAGPGPARGVLTSPCVTERPIEPGLRLTPSDSVSPYRRCCRRATL